jgi:hypothetical protein
MGSESGSIVLANTRLRNEVSESGSIVLAKTRLRNEVSWSLDDVNRETLEMTY